RFWGDADVFEGEVLALEADVVFPPELPQDLDAFGHAADPGGRRHTVVVQLHIDAGLHHVTVAGDEDGAAAGKLVKARPLVRQQDRIAQREARHACRAELYLRGPRRDGREQRDRLQPWLGQQAVPDP